eukprot:PhF_6_TR29239/c0_g1_i1/m.42796
MFNIPLLETEEVQKVSIPFAVSVAQPNQLQGIMQTYGFAIVTDVLESPESVQHHVDLFAQDLLALIHPDDLRTLSDDLRRDPVWSWPLNKVYLGNPFATEFGIPQGRLAWAIRQNSNVQSIFAALHETDKLCVGTDVVFFNNREAKPVQGLSLTPHVDQNSYIKPSGTWDIYQGLVYLTDAGEDTSSTVVMPRSHLLHEEIMGQFTDQKMMENVGHYIPVSKPYRDLFRNQARRVPVRRGSMVLWSSKTIHDGWNNGPRLAVPVSFEPVERRTKSVKEGKTRLVAKGIPTTHWASLGIQHDCYAGRKEAPVNGPFRVLPVAHVGVVTCNDSDTGIKPEIQDLL